MKRRDAMYWVAVGLAFLALVAGEEASAYVAAVIIILALEAK